MFVEGLKQGIIYTASVVERTFGIQASRLSLNHVVTKSKENNPLGLAFLAIDTSAAQVIAPSTTKVMRQVFSGNASESEARKLSNLALAAIALDFTSTMAVILYSANNQYSREEAVVVKYAANALTHVGLDLLEAGIKRIPNLRPPAPAALAV